MINEVGKTLGAAAMMSSFLAGEPALASPGAPPEKPAAARAEKKETGQQFLERVHDLKAKFDTLWNVAIQKNGSADLKQPGPEATPKLKALKERVIKEVMERSADWFTSPEAARIAMVSYMILEEDMRPKLSTIKELPIAESIMWVLRRNGHTSGRMSEDFAKHGFLNQPVPHWVRRQTVEELESFTQGDKEAAFEAGPFVPRLLKEFPQLKPYAPGGEVARAEASRPVGERLLQEVLGLAQQYREARKEFDLADKGVTNPEKEFVFGQDENGFPRFHPKVRGLSEILTHIKRMAQIMGDDNLEQWITSKEAPTIAREIKVILGPSAEDVEHPDEYHKEILQKIEQRLPYKVEVKR